MAARRLRALHAHGEVHRVPPAPSGARVAASGHPYRAGRQSHPAERHADGHPGRSGVRRPPPGQTRGRPMTASILLNGLGAVSLRLFQPYNGVWWAEVDVDAALVPPGPASIVIGQNEPIVGTVDPLAQGTFGQKSGARVVGGGNGWQQSVPPQHFHNDAGLLGATVISTTATAVGEVAVVAIPQAIGADYVRIAGPASSVLAGHDWYVDLLGVTQV